MADDFDVEAMLEAPYKKEDEAHNKENGDKDSRRRRSRSRDKKERRRSRSRDRKRRSRSRDRKDRHRRSRSRERRRSPVRERRERRRSRDRKSRSRSRERRERPKREEREKKSKSPDREGYMPYGKKEALPELTPEERDARTVFCMQLAAHLRPRDLMEFFSSVGKVRDVRIITDNKNRRSKGIAYVEFADVETVPLALGLAGQKLLGVPIVVQQSMAEKNRMAGTGQPATGLKGMTGPMRLYVGSLHFNITEEMLRAIFEPFGKIDHINLVMDNDTQRSKGFGFVTFHNAEDAQKALQQLNGFELAGRGMKVGHVTERTTADMAGQAQLDTDELDRAGVDLGATGRLALMAKLAEGTGFNIPQVAANALSLPGNTPAAAAVNPVAAPPIATQCFMLSNMFDPTTETNPNWENEIRDDVIEECNKHGGVLHIYVDQASPQGNVYVKCPSIASAVNSVGALHGRWFAGKMITAAYVPLPNYHGLFPDALRSTQLVMPATRAVPPAQPVMPTMM